jgi:penicillin-binding protein 2
MNRVVSSDYQTLLAENTPTVVSKLDMKPETIDAYIEGMYLVTTHWRGTAFNNRAWKAVPVKVAGKTSTAQQFWGASDNGAFVCFAPKDDPEIAISVYVEKGGHGSTLASIARSLILEYLNEGTVSDVTTYENKLS